MVQHRYDVKMKTTGRPSKSKKQKKPVRESAGKKWLNYIQEGGHYSLNTTSNGNVGNQVGGSVKKGSSYKQQQLNNASVNSAEIIKHMKRQNLTGETLNKLLGMGVNNQSKQELVIKPSPVKVKKGNVKLQQQPKLTQYQQLKAVNRMQAIPVTNSTELQAKGSKESFQKQITILPVQRTKTTTALEILRTDGTTTPHNEMLSGQGKVMHDNSD